MASTPRAKRRTGLPNDPSETVKLALAEVLPSLGISEEDADHFASTTRDISGYTKDSYLQQLLAGILAIQETGVLVLFGGFFRECDEGF